MLSLGIWVIPVILFVLFAVRQRSRANRSLDSADNSIDIHKSRLDGLTKQFEAGELTEEEYLSFKLEEEKALLADTELSRIQETDEAQMKWVWVPVLSVIAIGLAFVIYNSVGSYDAVKVRDQFKQLSLMTEMDETLIENTLDNYEALLESEPDNIEGWFQLSQMQLDMSQFEQAIVSLEHVLVEIRKIEHNAEDEAALLSYIGQAQMSLGNREEALASFVASLEYFQTSTALGMAGRMSMELGQYKESIDYWTRLKLVTQGTDTDVIDGFIEQAKASLADQGIDYEVEQPARIIVTVELPAAWEGLSKDAALFIYARPIGQRMPLAVKRMAITSQRVVALLSDADAMGPMGGISTQDIVEVTARVSLTGIANTQPGDWLGTVEEVAIDSKEMSSRIKISQP